MDIPALEIGGIIIGLLTIIIEAIVLYMLIIHLNRLEKHTDKLDKHIEEIRDVYNRLFNILVEIIGERLEMGMKPEESDQMEDDSDS